MQLKKRSVMLDQLAQQIYSWSYEEPDRPYFSTFYMEQDSLYALFNGRGMLFRATVNVDSDGETLVLGELETVMHQFTPVERSSFTIVRQADGNLRYFMVAGTAILNRVNEIDSTLLFDDMIRRAEQYDYYPKLDFYHLGEVDPMFEFGQFDFLAREGVVYVGSGILQPEHPLSVAMERAVSKEPGKWGASIEYFRPENRGMEFVELGEGVSIVAFTEGLNTRISILPEDAAAAWFTDVEMETRQMDERKKKALRALFGDDTAYEAFIAKLGGINEEVERRGLVTREATETPATETPAPEKAPEVPTVELDDEAVAAIVAVARTQFEEVFKVSVQAVTEAMTKLQEQQTALSATLNGMQERITYFEQEDEQKQREWKGDLPAHLRSATRVTYRPRKEAEVNEAVEPTVTDQANSVLSKLPKVGI